MNTEAAKAFTVAGITGHWHKELELPCGYQHFNWFPVDAPNDHGVTLNPRLSLVKQVLKARGNDELYLYTQHQIFYEEGILKHTRSSPNWEGGLVTYSTCKHLMRTYDRISWAGTWLAGLCPAHCEQNCALFVGRIDKQFASNYDLSRHVNAQYPSVCRVKQANTNPRGDLYAAKAALHGGQRYDHNNFVEPPNHTRSVEMYKKSPGSTSTRPDGQIPKWWRDLEYTQRGRRPPSFILSPCWLFSCPMLWTTYKPRRAVLRLTCKALADSLADEKTPAG